MTTRSIVWWVVAVLFSAVNLGGAVMAGLVGGEPVHAGLHAGLAVLGVYLVWRLAPRRQRVY